MSILPSSGRINTPRFISRRRHSKIKFNDWKKNDDFMRRTVRSPDRLMTVYDRYLGYQIPIIK
jgi:hypothetical protein